MNKMKIVLNAAMILTACVFHEVAGNGRLMIPPQRSSLWRDQVSWGDPRIDRNYNDHTLNCGGMWKRDMFEGRCGICGDPWDAPEPRPNEAGGIYARGLIGRTYSTDVRFIDAEVQVTSSMGGFFEFRLCPNNDIKHRVTQECLDQYQLNILSKDMLVEYGQQYFTDIVPGKPGQVQLLLEVPEGMECTQCVLQWRWHGGVDYGICSNGQWGKGCGKQNEIFNCADIAILPPEDKSPVLPGMKETIDKQDRHEIIAQNGRGRTTLLPVATTTVKQSDPWFGHSVTTTVMPFDKTAEGSVPDIIGNIVTNEPNADWSSLNKQLPTGFSKAFTTQSPTPFVSVTVPTESTTTTDSQAIITDLTTDVFYAEETSTFSLTNPTITSTDKFKSPTTFNSEAAVTNDTVTDASVDTVNNSPAAPVLVENNTTRLMPNITEISSHVRTGLDDLTTGSSYNGSDTANSTVDGKWDYIPTTETNLLNDSTTKINVVAETTDLLNKNLPSTTNYPSPTRSTPADMTTHIFNLTDDGVFSDITEETTVQPRTETMEMLNTTMVYNKTTDRSLTTQAKFIQSDTQTHRTTDSSITEINTTTEKAFISTTESSKINDRRGVSTGKPNQKASTVVSSNSSIESNTHTPTTPDNPATVRTPSLVSSTPISSSTNSSSTDNINGTETPFSIAHSTEEDKSISLSTSTRTPVSGTPYNVGDNRTEIAVELSPVATTNFSGATDKPNTDEKKPTTKTAIFSATNVTELPISKENGSVSVSEKTPVANAEATVGNMTTLGGKSFTNVSGVNLLLDSNVSDAAAKPGAEIIPVIDTLVGILNRTGEALEINETSNKDNTSMATTTGTGTNDSGINADIIPEAEIVPDSERVVIDPNTGATDAANNQTSDVAVTVTNTTGKNDTDVKSEVSEVVTPLVSGSALANSSVANLTAANISAPALTSHTATWPSPSTTPTVTSSRPTDTSSVTPTEMSPVTPTVTSSTTSLVTSSSTERTDIIFGQPATDALIEIDFNIPGGAAHKDRTTTIINGIIFHNNAV